MKQLAHELEIIERTNLAEFFLIVWDLMEFARKNGIIGQGRGSAGDSIVAYCLGITKVDPIAHKLLFERFINEARTLPDIDIDFDVNRREEVIQYLYNQYGADHAAMVCTVITYRARSAVREVAKALGFPLEAATQRAGIDAHVPDHAVGMFERLLECVDELHVLSSLCKMLLTHLQTLDENARTPC